MLLFRKILYDNEKYYQLYKIDNNFEMDGKFAEFDERESKDFFYVEIDSDRISEKHLYTLFYDKEGEFDVIDDPHLYLEVFNKAKEMFSDLKNKNISIREFLESDKVIEIINREILYQEEAVTKLVNRIYQNQDILASDVPDSYMKEQKENILLYGTIGSGKTSIIELLKDNLNIPHADITLGMDINDIVSDIIEQLTNTAANDTEASSGIVFIRDDFEDLRNVYGNKVYEIIDFLSSQDKISYEKNEIDFSKLTFVVLLNPTKEILNNKDKLDEIKRKMNIDFVVTTRLLTDKEKYQVLLSKKGRINYYSRILEPFNKKLKINRNSLKRLIRECSKISPDMGLLNEVLSKIFSDMTKYGFCDVVIDDNCVNKYIPKIDKYAEKDAYTKNKASMIIESSVKTILPKVLETVVGQDEHVKRILYAIIENRRMANDKSLDNPKKYIDNILIRGESGGGKTLIIETISKLLNIPFFSADATKFTEAGYKGADVEDMLVELLHNADDDLEKAQKGILDIDEIDKKAGHGDVDVSRGAVQNGLLKIFEGATIPIDIGDKLNPKTINFDTSRLTVIGKGAFEGIEKIRDDRIRRANGHTLGFNNEEKNVFVDKELTDDDFVKYGMQRQFMARLPIKIELNKNTTNTLKEIMLKSKISALKIQKYKFESKGIEVEYTPDFYDELAKYAYELKIGARGIEKALQKILTNIHIEDIEPDDVSKIIFTGEVVKNPEAIKIIPREKQKKLVRKK